MASTSRLVSEGGPHYGPSSTALSRRSILAYGTGHVLNDLTAACWFTYLLIFLQDVGLSSKQAGEVMLSGQAADGLATILIGQLIDRFGHFKLWHSAGSLLVVMSFSSVFGTCISCKLFGAESTSAITIGYSAFAAIFNLGWASAQVSHMSLVNCITANASSRVSLNSCRNAFSMIANLCLYAVAYAVFWILPATSATGVRTQFQWITGLAMFGGCCFVFIFQLQVGEPRLYHHTQALRGTVIRLKTISWFKRPLYYQVALVYMLTRLTTNVSQAFLPFYVVQDLGLGESSKAVVPALIYICSFLASIVLQELNWTSHRLKGFFAGGACLWIVSGAVIYLLPVNFKSMIYPMAAIVGLGNALMLVTATSMQGVLVGDDWTGCGFVYGSMSFLDKLACGFVLYFIERLNDEARPCTQSGGSVFSCSDSLIRLALGLVPGGCALSAAVIALSLNLTESESDAFVLRKPLLNKVESVKQEEEGSTSHQKIQGSIRENARSSAKPFAPSRPGSMHRISVSSEEGADLENDRFSSSSEEPQFSLWRTLESAMVGRWGSIRSHPQTWLE